MILMILRRLFLTLVLQCIVLLVSVVTSLDKDQISIPSLGLKKAIAQEIDGSYHVTGKNPDGTSYSGEANIKHKGDHYEVIWRIGDKQTFYGTGTLSDNTLKIDWNGDVVTYVIQQDGKLQGSWASGKATETLIPLRHEK